jgi:hypothetical protein
MTTLDIMKGRIGHSHFFDEKRRNRHECDPSRSMLREHNGGYMALELSNKQWNAGLIHRVVLVEGMLDNVGHGQLPEHGGTLP